VAWNFWEGTLLIDLNEDQLAALKRAALNGDYHLLLGAGASRETKSSDGTLLPMASQLGEQIATEFNIPIETGDLLWRLYARAVDEAGEGVVYSWFRSRFWDVEPPPWMDVYARTPWAMVWTLNLDDSFEQAYLRVKSEESRPLLTVNWDDEFRIGNELSVVHLHGCVDKLDPRRLIFSLSEYASAAVAGRAWPLNFRDIYGISPFVVIGARLRDEPDIEAVVANRRPAHEAPSFYVSPNITPAMERDLRKWNLVPVPMTAEGFSELWPELTGILLNEPPRPREELAMRVGRQFRELRTNVMDVKPAGHDFIGGDEPLWIDIQESLYAELDWIRQASQECRQLSKPPITSSALIYVGRRTTGRSTGLLALAKELRGLSWRTFFYVADGRPDVDALTQYASDGRAIALFFDSISDIADDIGELISQARQSGLHVVCVAVDAIDREATILGRVDEAFLSNRRVGAVNDRLTNTDAGRLVDKLGSLGRLGFLEAERRDNRRRNHFRNSELFDAMAQLENAPGFGRRVGGLVDLVRTPKELELLLIAVLASRFGRRLHLMDAGRMLALESDAVVKMIRPEQSAGALLRLSGPWVRTRHRGMALKPCIDHLGEHRALEVLGEAMQRSGPRLGRSSLRARNATALLVGSFMSYNNIKLIFPSADLDSWYEQLMPTFGEWSARYWEQRAITARHDGVSEPSILSKAESYALRAVSIVRDAFSLTTLGTVLLAKAAFSPQISVGDYYDRAFDAYEEASQEDPRNIITWLAFLRHSLEVLDRVRGSEDREESELAERITDDWLRIYSQISSVANAGDRTRSDLASLMRRYTEMQEQEE
jgi:hypothetical protein